MKAHGEKKKFNVSHVIFFMTEKDLFCTRQKKKKKLRDTRMWEFIRASHRMREFAYADLNTIIILRIDFFFPLAAGFLERISCEEGKVYNCVFVSLSLSEIPPIELETII